MLFPQFVVFATTAYNPCLAATPKGPNNRRDISSANRGSGTPIIIVVNFASKIYRAVSQEYLSEFVYPFNRISCLYTRRILIAFPEDSAYFSFNVQANIRLSYNGGSKTLAKWTVQKPTIWSNEPPRHKELYSVVLTYLSHSPWCQCGCPNWSPN